jgi:hypothetical protein
MAQTIELVDLRDELQDRLRGLRICDRGAAAFGGLYVLIVKGSATEVRVLLTTRPFEPKGGNR